MRPAIVFDVLIASPSDVTPERNAVEEATVTWNAINAGSGAVLRPRRWERDAVPGLGRPAQEQLNEQFVDDCDICIGIFWSRLGTPTRDAASGTVEEIQRLHKRGRRVMLYFSERPRPKNVSKIEVARLEEFQQQCYRKGLCADYTDHSDLRMSVLAHLSKVMPELMEGQQALMRVEAKFLLQMEVLKGVDSTVTLNAESLKAADTGPPEFEIEPLSFDQKSQTFKPAFRVSQRSGTPLHSVSIRVCPFGTLGGWHEYDLADGRNQTVGGSYRPDRPTFTEIGHVAVQIRYERDGLWQHERRRWTAKRLVGVGETTWVIEPREAPPDIWTSESADDVIPPDDAAAAAS